MRMASIPISFDWEKGVKISGKAWLSVYYFKTFSE